MTASPNRPSTPHRQRIADIDNSTIEIILNWRLGPIVSDAARRTDDCKLRKVAIVGAEHTANVIFLRVRRRETAFLNRHSQQASRKLMIDDGSPEKAAMVFYQSNALIGLEPTFA